MYRGLVVLFLSCLSVVVQAAVYKCVDSQGRTTFSDSRCDVSERQEVQGGLPADASKIHTPSGIQTVDSPFGARLWFEWGKVGTSLMEANFVVYNDNYYDVSDIEIECILRAKSGTRLDKNVRTIYDVVPARSRKGFTKFNMGFVHSQATNAQCSIISLSK